jgi:hypothetical protein
MGNGFFLVEAGKPWEVVAFSLMPGIMISADMTRILRD